MSGTTDGQPAGLVKEFDFALGESVTVSFVGTIIGRSESSRRAGDSYLVEFKRADGSNGTLWLPDFFIDYPEGGE